MHRRALFVLMGLTQLAGASACDSTRPFISNVDLARQTWLTSRPAAYTFEVASAYSWFPRSDFVRVDVEDGIVVQATDPSGDPVEGFTLTVDSLWGRVLTARERGELNSARFDRNGVPIEIDYGPWELDGGVAFWVRHFVRRP